MVLIRSSVDGGSGAVPTTTIESTSGSKRRTSPAGTSASISGHEAATSSTKCFGEVDGPSERVPRTLRRQRHRRQPQVFFMAREMAGDPAVLQR